MAQKSMESIPAMASAGTHLVPQGTYRMSATWRAAMNVIATQNHARGHKFRLSASMKPSTATQFHIGKNRFSIPNRSNSQAHKEPTAIPGNMARLGKRRFFAALMSRLTSLAMDIVRRPLRYPGPARSGDALEDIGPWQESARGVVLVIPAHSQRVGGRRRLVGDVGGGVPSMRMPTGVKGVPSTRRRLRRSRLPGAVPAFGFCVQSTNHALIVLPLLPTGAATNHLSGHEPRAMILCSDPELDRARGRAA
jgi:hypothetical protein